VFFVKKNNIFSGNLGQYIIYDFAIKKNGILYIIPNTARGASSRAVKSKRELSKPSLDFYSVKKS